MTLTDMKAFSKPLNRLAIVSFGILSIILVIVIITFIRKTEFMLISSTPTTGERITSDTKDISFTFNEKLDATKPPTVTSYPSTPLATAVDGSTLKVFFPQGLQEDKDYSVLLRGISSQGKKRIELLSIAFFSEDRSPAAPLRRATPIEQSDFSLNYNHPTKRFFVISKIADRAAIESQVAAIFQRYNLGVQAYPVDYQFSNSAMSKLDPNFNPPVEDYTGDGSPPVYEGPIVE